MPRRYYSSTAARTTLAAPITNVAGSLVVNAATGFPGSVPWTAILDADTVNEEVVTVTGVAGTTLTVTRGQDGTSGVAHSAGAAFQHGVSARDFDETNAFVNGTGVVTTGHLADGAVTAAKIPDGGVTNVKLANSSVTINGSSVSLGGSTTIQSETFAPFFLIGV